MENRPYNASQTILGKNELDKIQPKAAISYYYSTA